MKRPLAVIAAGFVLGEVLGLQAQEVVEIITGAAALLSAVVGAVWFLQGRGRVAASFFKPILAAFSLFLLCLAAGAWMGGREADRLDQEEKRARAFEGVRATVSGWSRDLEVRKDRLVLTLEDVTAEAGEKSARFGTVLVYLDRQEEGQEEALAPGRKIWLKGRLEPGRQMGNPGEFDFRSYCRSRGAASVLYADKALMSEGKAVAWRLRLLRFRQSGSRILERCCRPEDRGVYQAILLGDTSYLDEEVQELYRDSGISHLLAVSGQHLSLIGGGMYLMFRLAAGGYVLPGAAGGLLAVSYGFLTGGSVSVLRAVVMLLMLWLARSCGRTYDTLSALGLSALLLTAAGPYRLLQSGFQLSFLAVWAIGGPGAWLNCQMEGARSWEKGLFVGLAVQAVLLPASLWHFYQYPLCGFFVNLLILPAVSLVMYLGIGILAVGGVWIGGGKMIAACGGMLLEYIRRVCELSGRIPGSCLILGRPGWGQILCYGLVIASASAAAVRLRKKRQTRCFLLFLLLTATFYLSIFLLCLRPSGELSLLCMDVGQGDGFLLKSGKEAVLIDGGSSDRKNLGKETLKPCLMSQGISELRYAVVSHGDSDHISGIEYLLENPKKIRIRTLVLPQNGRGQEVYDRLEALQTRAGGETRYLNAGERLTAGELELLCIYEGEAGGDKAEDRNSHSLVLCAHFAGNHLLFTGDMGEREERALLAQDRYQEHLDRAAVLKVAHHGSRSSTCQPWLERLPVKLAILSYGKNNSYGHPSPEVTAALKQKGCSVWETGGRGGFWVKIGTEGRVRVKRACPKKDDSV